MKFDALTVKKLIAPIVCTALVACAGVTAFFNTPSVQLTAAQLATQALTIRLINADPQRAAAVVTGVDDALEVLRSGGSGTVSPADVQKALDLVFPGRFNPEEKQLVSEFTVLLVQAVVAYVPADQQAALPIEAVSTVLSWVREAAVLAEAEGDGYGSATP